jgi:hypothetical protein
MMRSSSAWSGAPFLVMSVLLVPACLSTPEPKAPPPGVVSSWSTEFSRIDWMSEWSPKKTGSFGRDNTSVEEDAKSPGGRFLRVRYYKGGASPSASRRDGVREGGAQVLGTFESGPVDHVFLRYFVRFPANFEFVKGGKLPGFYGGAQISGGHIPDGTNGFSTRFMWRTDGQGEVYAYLPSSTRFGTSLGRGSWHFARDQWQCIEQELKLNTPGTADGAVHVWLDGKPVYQNEQLLFRTTASLRAEGVFFSTFFGGGDSSWAPPADTYADFAAFAVAPARVGCTLAGSVKRGENP